MNRKMIFGYASALILAMLCSCSKSDEQLPQEPEQPEQEIPTEGEAAFSYHYFTAIDAEYCSGSVSSDGDLTAPSLVECSTYAITGGVVFLSVESAAELTHLAVGLSGSDADGYYMIPVWVEQGSVDGVMKYSVELLVSGYISSAMKLVIAGSDGEQITTQRVEQSVELCRLNDSALRVSVSFTGNKDIDLHLVMPDGREIYYGDDGDFTLSGTQLFGQDLMSNNGCVIDMYRCESIYLTEEYLLAGEYKVYINLYGNCDPFSESLYCVRAIQDGVDIKSPYLGSFDPADEQNRDPELYQLIHQFTL